MKRNVRSNTARAAIATLFLLTSIALLCAIPIAGSQTTGQHNARAVQRPIPQAVDAPNAGPNPGSGAISVTTTTPVTWVGTTISPGGNANTESTCMENSPAFGCETYTLTVNGSPSDWTGKKIKVLLTWTSVSNEYDLFIHKTSNAGPLITSAMQGPALTNQFVFIDPAATGTGVYTVHVVYDTTPTSATDPYHGSISVFDPNAGSGPTAAIAPEDNGPAIGYENFEAPGLLTQGTSTSSGAVTVEYLGRNAGEPSIGVNWLSTSNSVGGVTNFQSDLQTLFVNWDESCSLTIPKATWVNRRAPTSVAIDSDPIGFTDRQTGRVFASELTLLGSDTSKIAFSDDDGLNWTIDQQAQGLASAVDHQTMGGGPYNPNSLPPPPPGLIYPNAVYYCSQDIATAFCSRSDNGGLTFGSQTPLYDLTTCAGLHGHVKVAPDGTAYVPNRACGTNTAVVVSTDNGLTWTVRPVTNGSVPVSGSSDDPSVAIDAAGKVYCLFALNGTTAAVAMSTDKGQTWKNIYDVGAKFGIKNVAFPAAVAGDAGRAAVAFYGSVTSAGDSSADQFPGVWHLYVSHTFDGGDHWTTTDVTPQFPMQRMGLLRGGGGPADRNLLDFFDVSMDRDGRVQVGYVNGCSGGPCSQAPIAADGSNGIVGNAYTVTATIARQSSGRRMLSAKDPASPTSVPGMPFVTEIRSGNVVKLAWNEADNGNSPILHYQILRGTSSNNELPLVTIPGTQTTYTDNSATDATQTYYYKVVALNAVGSSCANNEISAPYIGDTCNGMIIHRNLPTHPESVGGAGGQSILPQYLIDYIAVGEPPGTSQLMFRMKVGNLTVLPPSSRWRMVWDWVGTTANPNPDEQYYVGMTTDQNGTPTFEYGTVATLSAVVLGVPQENPLGAPDSANFNADGTITIFVAKSKVGTPQPGDLLGAVNGRTFNTGDTPPETLERSTGIVDHTFVKGNVDNSYPPATYTVVGNTVCSGGNIEPVTAVSRKTHGSTGTFDIDLPLTSQPGIECRTGPTSGNHKVVITFAVPVTVSNVTVSPGTGKSASSSGFSVSNSEVTVNLTNVSNAQTLTINLIGVTGGANSGNVAIPMAILLGDVNSSRHVDAGDVGAVQRQNSQGSNLSNFRADVNASGHIDAGDVGIVQRQNSTGL